MEGQAPVVAKRALLSKLAATLENRGAGLPRKSAHAKGYGKSDTENVYDHTDDHQLQGKRTLDGSGEWHHDAIHEEIDGHAIERA